MNTEVKVSETGKGGAKRTVLLNFVTGATYDENGKALAKWVPAKDEKNKMLATYATSLLAGSTACAVASVDKERGLAMFGDYTRRLQESERDIALMSEQGGERIVKMDLGIGDVHVPAALPNFLMGYKNNPPMADVIAPPVMSSKQSDYFWQFAKEDAFQRALPVQAAGGGTVFEVNPRPSNTLFGTIGRSLGGFLATELQANADPALKLSQATMRRIANALLLEREIRCATIYGASGSYDSTVVAAAAAKWNGGVSSDPVNDILARKEKFWGNPSGTLISERVWDAFITNPAVRAYYGFKGDSSLVMPKPSEIQALLNLPAFYVGGMKYINTAGVLDYVWGNNAQIFQLPSELPPQTAEEVSTGYTFRWDLSGLGVADGVVKDGMMVRQFFDPTRGDMGGWKIVLVHYDVEMVTSKFAAGLITGAYA